MDRAKLRDSDDAQYLGVARLLREVGVFELLGSYIVNVPAGAYFLPNFELQAAVSAAWITRDDADDAARVVRDFERRVLIAADGTALNRLPPPADFDILHDVFFEALEQCGRDSPWPDVKLFNKKGNGAGDVLHISADHGISFFEYKELLHVCGRYAAPYPTLDEAVRDELLAPQRAHFACEILFLLDNRGPLVEVPPRYQDELDGLRRDGW